MVIEIIPSTLKHARELSKTLRPEDKQEAIHFGLDPNKAAFYSFRRALYRLTAVVDGEVAAMWGVIGTPMSNIGRPYLITGTAVNKVSPLVFTRIYKQEVQNMMKLFPVLENYVDASYYSAVRMLKLIGFTISKPFEYNGNLFNKFSIV